MMPRTTYVGPQKAAPETQGLFLVPVLPANALSTFAFTGNTTLRVAMVSVPTDVTARSLMLNVASVGVAGALRLALFSGNGERRLLDVVTPSISGAGAVTVTLQHLLTLIADSYYLAVLPQGTANITLTTWGALHPTGLVLPAGETALHATATVTADTMPEQVRQSTLTVATDASIPVVRVLPVARALP